MKRITKAIIPAAGLGTRMQFLSDGKSKEMLPIGRRPMIFYVIQEAVLSGLEELYIIINSRKDTLCRYLESEDVMRDLLESYGQNIPPLLLTFIDQPTPIGSGDAIYRTRELIGEGPFALMMPDFICFGVTPALGQMIPLYEQCERDIVGLLSLRTREAEGFGNVGIVQGEKKDRNVVTVRSLSGKISNPLIVKNNVEVLKAVSRWILGPNFFSYLERTKEKGEWDDTPALQLLCTEREVKGKILQGRGFDVGNPIGYQAAEAFAAHLDAGS